MTIVFNAYEMKDSYMSIMNVHICKYGTSGLSILLANFVPMSRYIR